MTTTVSVQGMEFEVAAFSEKGPRPENQDAYLLDDFAGHGLLALADGMGGEKSGRIAADLALESLRSSAPIRTVDGARRAVRDADRQVAARAESAPDQYGGMGCALGLLSFVAGADGPGWIAAHVGDVRILSRSPDGLVRLETRDHTPAFARWEAGEISLDEIPDSAGANRLQRAIGRGGEADAGWLPAGRGWAWLIVSDGIYKVMRLDELSGAMGAADAEAALEVVRRKVEERGADDNFTAVFVRAGGPPPAAVAEQTSEMRTPARTGRGSAATGIAAALAVLALVLAGAALWTAREAMESGAERTELEILRTEVDSLRSIVTQLRDPFGPSAADPTEATVPNSQPPATQPQLP